jgi:tetratricopeptide (TPR) repeat protein
MNRKSVFFLAFFLLTFLRVIYSGTKKDSLYQVWRFSGVDTLRLKAANNLGWKYLYSQPDSALYFAQEQIKLAQKIKNDEYISSAYNLLGGVQYIKGNNISAIEYYELSRDYAKKGKNKMALASVLNNLGLIYSNEGLYSKALDCFQQSIVVYTELDAKHNKVKAHINIGTVYENISDKESAMVEYKKAIAQALLLNDPQILAMSYGSLGNVHSSKGSFERAKQLFDSALVFAEKADDKRTRSALLNNLGNMMNSNKRFNEALNYFILAKGLSEGLGDQRGLAHILFNLGECYLGLNRKNEAMDVCEQGLEIALRSETVAEMKGNCSCLYKAYKMKGDYKKALHYFEQAKMYEDSLQNMEMKKTITRQSVAFEYNKKIAADSIRNLEQQKVKDLQLASKEAQLKQEEQMKLFLAGGIFLALVFGVFMFNRYRLTQKQNRIIAEQKTLVEQKQSEIIDSIRYAKRIQNAIISSEYYISKELKKLRK